MALKKKKNTPHWYKIYKTRLKNQQNQRKSSEKTSWSSTHHHGTNRFLLFLPGKNFDHYLQASLRAQQIGSNDVVHLIFKDQWRVSHHPR